MGTTQSRHISCGAQGCFWCHPAVGNAGLQSRISDCCVAVFQATLFQTLPLQTAEAQVVSTTGQQSAQAVTDVIQQLLELSEPGPVESNPSPQPGQQLSITVGLNQDILQVKPVCLLAWGLAESGACRRKGRIGSIAFSMT